MALPKQVEEAARKADEMAKEQGGVEEPSVNGKTDEKNIPEESPKETLDTTPKAPEPDEVDKDWKPEYEKEKHKYDVLQGKYSKEVPRLSAENKELIAKNEEIESQIASMREELDGIKNFDDDEKQKLKEDFPNREDFPDIADYVDRMIDTRFKEANLNTSNVTQKVDTLEERVNKSAEDTYIKKLTRLVPDWKTIMGDEDFALSLQEVEPYSGRTKHDLAMEAQDNLDADRVARFYKDFSNSKEPPEEKPKGKEVGEFVSPGAGKSPAPVDTAEPVKPFTKEEIKHFYSAYARGHFKGEEGEKRAKKIEAQINAYLVSKKE